MSFTRILVSNVGNCECDFKPSEI